MDMIVNRIEELMLEYRDAKLYGEFFGLKIALEIIKHEGGERDDDNR